MIECVGGALTGKLLECLPPRSTCCIYGLLSEEPFSEIDPLLLIGRSYKIESFILGAYIQSQGIWMISTINKVNAMMADGSLQSKIHKQLTLSQFQTCLGEYYQNMSAGKFILEPHALDEELTDGRQFKEFDIIDLKTSK